MILHVDDPLVARHLAAALQAHARRCRRDALPVPAPLLALLAGLVASDGHTRPRFDPIGVDGDHDGVTPLMLSYRDAADALSVSERSVRRLVATERLPAVDVGGSRRIRTSDLVSFVAHLHPANAREVSAG